MDSIQKLIRPDLLNFKPYNSAHAEAKPGRVWLNANELPWDNHGTEALHVNRYPARRPKNLVTKLSQIYQVQPEQMTFLGGSDEGIDLLVRLFCRAGQDAIMICPPTFGMYRVCAQLQGAKILEVPMQAETFQLDLASIDRAWTPEVKLIFVCSPNNPTGNVLSRQDLETLCARYRGKSIIVADEAYLEFAEVASMAEQLNQYNNLVVLRTLSKAYGLAGARFGVMLAQPEIISWIEAIMMPYPLPIFTTDAVARVLSAERLKQLEAQRALIIKERTRLTKILSRIPIVLKVWDSHANFILLKVKDAAKIMDQYEAAGITLRQITSPPYLENCLRITIGTEDENNQVVKILEDLNKAP